MLTTLQASTASSPGLTAELVGSSAHLWLLHTKLGITNVTKIPRNAISLAGTLVLSTKILSLLLHISSDKYHPQENSAKYRHMCAEGGSRGTTGEGGGTKV